MTNATDLLWWDDDDGVSLAAGAGVLHVYGEYDGWHWMRQLGSGLKHHSAILHPTREAAMQAAVDAAEATIARLRDEVERLRRKLKAAEK